MLTLRPIGCTRRTIAEGGRVHGLMQWATHARLSEHVGQTVLVAPCRSEFSNQTLLRVWSMAGEYLCDANYEDQDCDSVAFLIDMVKQLEARG